MIIISARMATRLLIFQLFIDSTLNISPESDTIGICLKQHEHYHFILYAPFFPPKHQMRRSETSPLKARICVATMPATPFSLSHHQSMSGSPYVVVISSSSPRPPPQTTTTPYTNSPAHNPIFLPLPVAPSRIVSTNLNPHPCSFSLDCRFNSGISVVSVGLART